MTFFRVYVAKNRCADCLHYPEHSRDNPRSQWKQSAQPILMIITFDGDASTLNTLMRYFEKLDKGLHEVLYKEPY